MKKRYPSNRTLHGVTEPAVASQKSMMTFASVSWNWQKQKWFSFHQ